MPCTGRSSNPAARANSESKCRGFLSWLTLEYSPRSSFVNILLCLKTSPILSTTPDDDVDDHDKYLKEYPFTKKELLTNILVNLVGKRRNKLL